MQVEPGDEFEAERGEAAGRRERRLSQGLLLGTVVVHFLVGEHAEAAAGESRLQVAELAVGAPAFERGDSADGHAPAGSGAGTRVQPEVCPVVLNGAGETEVDRVGLAAAERTDTPGRTVQFHESAVEERERRERGRELPSDRQPERRTRGVEEQRRLVDPGAAVRHAGAVRACGRGPPGAQIEVEPEGSATDPASLKPCIEGGL